MRTACCRTLPLVFATRLFHVTLMLLVIFAGQLQSGLMPVQGADGRLVLTICAGDGPLLMVLDPETGRMKPAAGKASCDWAGGLVAALAEVLPEAAVIWRPGVGPVTAVDLWRPAHDPRGLWARGPPRLM